MAQFPCEQCGRRYRGRGNRAYFSIVDGAYKWDHKPRLCPPDAQKLVELFDQVDGEILDEDNGQGASDLCIRCNGNARETPTYAVFMTFYGSDGLRRDFYAVAHEGCVPDLRTLVAGPSQAA